MSSVEEDSVEGLRAALALERAKNAQLLEELRRVKQLHAQLHLANEMEEESIANKLIKAIRALETDKAKLLLDLDREQESLTNALQRKLSAMSAEKDHLESLLRKDAVEPKFDRKPSSEIETRTSPAVSAEELRVDLEERKSDRACLFFQLHKTIEQLKDGTFDGDPEKILDLMAAEINRLHAQHIEFERAQGHFKSINRKLEEQLRKLENDNFVLQQKISHQKEFSKQLSVEKALLEQQHEVHMERDFIEARKSDVSLTDLRIRLSASDTSAIPAGAVSPVFRKGTS